MSIQGKPAGGLTPTDEQLATRPCKLLLAAKNLYKERIESLCGDEGIWINEEKMLEDTNAGHLWRALKEAIEEKELEL